MRTAATLLLFASLTMASAASAGTLARARAAVRSESPTSARSDEHDRDSGKLGKARKEVRQQSSRSGGHHGGSSHARSPRQSFGGGSLGFFSINHYQPCCPPPVVETYVYPAEPVVAAPTYVEPIAPTPAESFGRQFAPYPYACGCDGFMVCDAPELGQAWSGRLAVELGSDFDGIDRSGVSFLIEGTGGLGVDFAWNSLAEDLPGGGHDELDLGDCNLLYRIAESDRALVRAGLGAAWFGDRYDTDFGLNFTLKADLAPADPLVLSGELDLGRLGDAQHLHAAGTVGVLLDRCEFYGGYDFRRIGDVEIKGPMVGVRIWF